VFEEIALTVPFAPDPFSKDVLEADFWPGTTSGFPVIARNTDNHLQLSTR
jgi:hypothetical protein